MVDGEKNRSGTALRSWSVLTLFISCLSLVDGLLLIGGAFVVGALDPALLFCTRIREEVLRQDDVQDFGVVALIYCVSLLILFTIPSR